MAAPAAETTSGAPTRGQVVRALVLIGPVVALALLTFLLVDPQQPDAEMLTILLVVLPLLARTSLPVPSLVVVAIGATLTGSAFADPWVQILAGILASFEVGLRVGDRTLSFLAVASVAALMTVGLLAQDADLIAALALPFVILLPSWLVGDVVRSRRIDAVRRAEEAERAMREREEKLRAAALEERRHVARELHDVIAHGVSVMVIQAGAARQVVHSSPDEAEESLLAVEATGREAMAELRRYLGALGDDAADGGLAPQPGIADLGALVDRVRDAGLPATLKIEGQPAEVSASLDVTVYRIVQEALTNSLRYARQAATIVRLVWEPGQVRVEVLDDGPGVAAPGIEGAGRGLAGMRDRAALAGGHLEAGPRLGGGFGVRAWLPLEPAT